MFEEAERFGVPGNSSKLEINVRLGQVYVFVIQTIFITHKVFQYDWLERKDILGFPEKTLMC